MFIYKYLHNFSLFLFFRRVRKFADSYYELRHVCLSVLLSVSPSAFCPHGTAQLPLIFNIFDNFEYFLNNLLRKFIVQ